MFTLAHISDIHLGPLPKPRLRELASKRVTGYLNWRLNRQRTMGDSPLDRLVTDMLAQEPDHIANTGDILNIGLDAEIEAAERWMTALATPERMSFVPGNHDAYLRDTLPKLTARLHPWMGPDNGTRFPYLHRRGPLALIGLSSAVATAPFVAAGRIRKSQAEELAELLAETGKEGLQRVVMIHHPPIHGAAKARKRLYGIDLVQEAIRHNGAELVLHGHTHLPTIHHIVAQNGRKVPVVGVASASQNAGGRRPAAAYNLFRFSEAGLELVTRGLEGPDGTISELRRLQL